MCVHVSMCIREYVCVCACVHMVLSSLKPSASLSLGQRDRTLLGCPSVAVLLPSLAPASALHLDLPLQTMKQSMSLPAQPVGKWGWTQREVAQGVGGTLRPPACAPVP